MSFKKKCRQFQKNWKRGKYKTQIRNGSIGVAAICFVALGSYYLQGKQAEDEIENLRQMKQQAVENIDTDTRQPLAVSNRQILSVYRDMFIQNPDLIGWLTVEGTKIDYPIMWTPEQTSYYSNRGFDKKESQNGLLFLDGDSNINEQGGNLIVYGHNMKNGSMFADLLKYEKKSFWEEHKVIQLDTLYEARFYEVVSVAKSKEMDKLPYTFVNASKDACEEALINMKSIECYDTGATVEYGDDFLTLSTCDYSEPDGRFVVVAKRIE